MNKVGETMKKHDKWTPEEDATLMELKEKGLTIQEIANELTRIYNELFTYDAVRNRLRRTKKNKIEFHDRKNVGNTIEEYLEFLIKYQEEKQRFDDRQTEVTLEIDDDKPIGIVFTGDWHVGGLYTAHKEMLKDFKTMRDTDGLYNITMGDYADNYNSGSHKGGIFEQIENPDVQKDLVEHFFTKYLGEKNLAVIKGNHDQWEVRETSEDFVKYIARKIESPYLWYGGKIYLKLGEVTYEIVARHNYRGNSALNTTNSQRRLFDETQGDIIALAHLHYNESHAKTKAGKDTVWIRSGTYKITDDYTQWAVGAKGDIRQPMVILFPNQKKIIDFRDMYDGIPYLQMLRNSEKVTV